jgi:Hexameric tyrosine-coordinated heme protein (HTHP)
MSNGVSELLTFGALASIAQTPMLGTMDNTPTLVPGNSLITATPEEGRQLAVKLARLIVKYTQPDTDRRTALRAVYVDDARMLIGITQVVATEFATIAAANGYWRELR